MASTDTKIQISGLKKRKLTALRKQAAALGMTTAAYAKHLVEEGVLLEQRARTTSLDELLKPARQSFRRNCMSEERLDDLVDAARTRHHRRTVRRKA